MQLAYAQKLRLKGAFFVNILLFAITVIKINHEGMKKEIQEFHAN